ncbi:MAG TPA: secretion protein [Myxococcales bacterium]|jgi:type III secretion protein J
MKRIAALLAAVLALGGCKQTLQHGLDEAQANEIESLLHGAGIDARKTKEGGRDTRYAIEVPEESAAAALKLLNDYGLPREKAPGFGEVFGKGSMVPTAVEENALFLHALSGELARTLGALEGVVSARVHVVASPAGPSSSLRRQLQPRASVLLKVRNGAMDSLEDRKVEIQRLVAGSVEGLDAASVSVMLSELPVPPTQAGSLATPTAEPTRLPLFIAAAVVALLSGLLAFAFLTVRRLQRNAAQASDSAAIAEAVPAAR